MAPVWHTVPGMYSECISPPLSPPGNSLSVCALLLLSNHHFKVYISNKQFLLLYSVLQNEVKKKNCKKFHSSSLHLPACNYSREKIPLSCWFICTVVVAGLYAHQCRSLKLNTLFCKLHTKCRFHPPVKACPFIKIHYAFVFSPGHQHYLVAAFFLCRIDRL